MDTEYDDWKLHIQGAFPKDRLPEQGYVHIGLYVAWLIGKDLLDPDWVARSGVRRAVEAIKDRSDSACALRDMTEGRLASDMLSAQGAAFTGAYYAPEYGYARDYRRVFGRRADRYDVPDDWESYDRLAPVLERRYAEWIDGGVPELMPMPSLIPDWLALWRPKRG